MTKHSARKPWAYFMGYTISQWLNTTLVVTLLLTRVYYSYVKTGVIWDHDLTHWGRVTHICVIKLTIIGSDNGLSPGRHQAIIWTNAGILLIGHLGTNFSEILIGIQAFSVNKMHLKMSSAKWHPFCLGLNVLKNNSKTWKNRKKWTPAFILGGHLINLCVMCAHFVRQWKPWLTHWNYDNLELSH